MILIFAKLNSRENWNLVWQIIQAIYYIIVSWIIWAAGVYLIVRTIKLTNKKSSHTSSTKKEK